MFREVILILMRLWHKLLRRRRQRKPWYWEHVVEIELDPSDGDLHRATRYWKLCNGQQTHYIALDRSEPNYLRHYRECPN